MNDSLLVRQMRPLDISQVVEIERASHPEPWWSPGDFQRELESDGTAYVVASCDDRILGYAGLRVRQWLGHVTTVAVRPETRGQRIATVMISRLLDEGVQLGVRRFHLEVAISNQAARRLYGHLGFSIVGVRRRFYGPEDALIMEFWSSARSGN